MILFPAHWENNVTNFGHIKIAPCPGPTALDVHQAGSRSSSLCFHQFPASQPPPHRLLLLRWGQSSSCQSQNTGPGSPKSPITLEQAELKLQFQLWFPWNSPASCGLFHSWSGNTPSSAPTAAKFTKTGRRVLALLVRLKLQLRICISGHLAVLSTPPPSK